LVEKWIPCDLSWTLIFLKYEYAMKLRKNEAHCPKEIESKKLWSIMMISNPYKKTKN
jgi:hypothetical protein